jgi:uncharacterized protein YndB with AHSA1/START domain
MTAPHNPHEEPAGQELVIERIFDAPRELVWRAWTDPERMKRWWGPKDFTAPHITIDLRVGGKYVSCMRGPDGNDFWSTGVYRKLFQWSGLFAQIASPMRKASQSRLLTTE